MTNIENTIAFLGPGGNLHPRSSALVRGQTRSLRACHARMHLLRRGVRLRRPRARSVRGRGQGELPRRIRHGDPRQLRLPQQRGDPRREGGRHPSLPGHPSRCDPRRGDARGVASPGARAMQTLPERAPTRPLHPHGILHRRKRVSPLKTGRPRASPTPSPPSCTVRASPSATSRTTSETRRRSPSSVARDRLRSSRATVAKPRWRCSCSPTRRARST